MLGLVESIVEPIDWADCGLGCELVSGFDCGLELTPAFKFKLKCGAFSSGLFDGEVETDEYLPADEEPLKKGIASVEPPASTSRAQPLGERLAGIVFMALRRPRTIDRRATSLRECDRTLNHQPKKSRG